VREEETSNLVLKKRKRANIIYHLSRLVGGQAFIIYYLEDENARKGGQTFACLPSLNPDRLEILRINSGVTFRAHKSALREGFSCFNLFGFIV